MSASIRSSAGRLQGPLALMVLVGACGDVDGEALPTTPVAATSDVQPPTLDTNLLEGGVAEAVEVARTAVLADPQSAQAWLELGMVLDANSLFEPALPCYVRASELDPGSARSTHHAARMQHELGRLGEARTWIELALERAPDAAQVLRLSAAWHVQDGALEQAEQQFEAVRTRKPAWPDGGLGLARVALVRGEPEQAEQRAREVLAEHPDEPYGLHLLGSALRDQGRAEEAAEAFARAAGGLPSWNDPWVAEVEERLAGYNLEILEAKELLRQGQVEKVAERMAKLHARDPDNVTVQGMWTAALTQMGRFDEALQMLMAAESRQPDHFRIELNLAIVRWRRGDLDLALSHVQRSIELHESHAMAHMVHGQILGERQDAAGAIEAFSAALASGAEPRRVLPRLGRWLVALERWEEAAAVYGQAASELPEDASIHAYWGGSLAEAGELERAREVLERARTLEPSLGLLRSIEARLAELDAAESGR